MRRRPKLRDYLFKGQGGLEIFTRDLILAVIDSGKATNECPVHVKNDSLWRRMEFDGLCGVQIFSANPLGVRIAARKIVESGS
jgi:hypothetical protein